MRALFSQFSGLIGILTFVNQMLSATPVEKALLMGAGAGITVYVILLLGDVVIQRVLEHAATSAGTARSQAQTQEASTPASAEASDTESQDVKAA